jgi:alginate O-acetyltransferase complex protein AlgI
MFRSLMVFTDQVFTFLFLPMALGGLVVAARLRVKVAWLLLSSLAFYAYSAGAYTFLLLNAVLVSYLAGRWVTGHRGRLVKVTSLFVLFVPLLFVKYGAFIADSLGVRESMPWLAAAATVLPAGISFFTFQAVSYVLDVARRRVDPAGSLVTYGAYLSFFPQLIAGPVVRYADVAEDLKGQGLTKADVFATGVVRFAHGLGKKVLIADNAGRIVDAAYGTAPGEVTWAVAALGTVAYTVQIYFDFSGYSDMAIGLGQLFGIRFPENFLRPYASRSITEFWRRWHVTLSTWFRDYLYVPLGGNRRGATRTYVNLTIVFLATGLWHGAAWTFVAWGAFHGAFLVLERALWGKEAALRRGAGWRYAYALPVVMVGWVLFRATSFGQAAEHLRALVSVFSPRALELSDPLVVAATPSALAMTAVGFAMVLLLSGPSAGVRLESQLATSRARWMAAAYGVAALAAGGVAVLTAGFSPFLYFQF